MKLWTTLLLLLAAALQSGAAVKTQTVEYRDGDTVLEGYLAYDDSKTDVRPGVLVIHQWMGLTAYEKQDLVLFLKALQGDPVDAIVSDAEKFIP